MVENSLRNVTKQNETMITTNVNSWLRSITLWCSARCLPNLVDLCTNGIDKISSFISLAYLFITLLISFSNKKWNFRISSNM